MAKVEKAEKHQAGRGCEEPEPETLLEEHKWHNTAIWQLNRHVSYDLEIYFLTEKLLHMDIKRPSV